MNIKLIDYFAAHALEGIISQTPYLLTHIPDEAADVAYQYAVAMSERRKKLFSKMYFDDIDLDTDKKESEWLATK